MKNTKPVWMAVAFIAVAHAPKNATAQKSEGLPAVSNVTALEFKEKPRAAYPGFPDREALVYVRFNVGVDGKAYDVTLAEGGFHEKRFVDTAMRVVRNATFNPRLENGIPAIATGVTLPVRFSIDSKGAKREFVRESDKVIALVKSKDYAGAQFHAEWMLSEKVTLLYEFAMLHASLAQTYASQGEHLRALASLRQATATASMSLEPYVPGGPLPKVSSADFLFERDNAILALRLHFVLAAMNGHFLEAVTAHANAQALGGIPADDPTMPQFQRLVDHLRTAPMVSSKGFLDESGIWRHRPTFRTFTLRNVKGEIKGADLKCTAQSRSLEYASGVDWTIPATWQGCALRFEGAPGTTFDIFEFRSLTSE